MNMKRMTAAVMGICFAASSLTMPVFAEGEAAVRYDVNADGAFDIMDIISLTKYLHLKGKLANPSEGDVNGDNAVDIFDLDLMMRELVGLEPDTPQPSARAKLLSADYTGSGNISAVEISEEIALGQMKFALELIRNTMEEGENVLVSPYSVEQALGMTANGAGGKTLEEMENVLGGKIDALNPALFTLRISAPQEEYAKLFTANSIWVRQDYDLNPAFLQTNADYYGADAYKAPFNTQMLNDINNWVDTNTDHMIPKILNELGDDAVTVLVNAVAFDAKWNEPYCEEYIHKQTFTAADGTEQKVEMMYNKSDETLRCIRDDHAVGFRKYYQGSAYYFAALLPEEGMTPEAYLAQLTPKQLRKTLQSNGGTVINHGMPVFSYDYDASLKKTLIDMGMPTAFTDAADFNAMYKDGADVCIDDVIHKTHIEVNSAGTRAGAATAVIIRKNSVIEVEDPVTVILDRPFVYMIVDANTDLPIFLGTVNSVETPAE